MELYFNKPYLPYKGMVIMLTTMVGQFFSIQGHHNYKLVVREASFLVHSMALNFAIYIFQVDRHSVNVLNVSTCI